MNNQELIDDLSYPRECSKLSLKQLTVNKEYTITATGGYSKQHKTPLIDVRDGDNNIYQNVICNSSLARLSSWNGIGKRFKIASIVESESKFGDKVFCSILPLDGIYPNCN